LFNSLNLAKIRKNQTLFLKKSLYPMKNNIYTAICAALEASDAIMEIYKNGFETTLKDDHTPLTTADLASEKIIRSFLEPTNICIISEETDAIAYEKRKNESLCWLVDPLDGTREFIKKNDEFAISIGLIKDQQPIGGVILAPALAVMYFGLENLGVYKIKMDELTADHQSLDDIIKESTALDGVSSTNRAPRIAGSRSHQNQTTLKYTEELKEIFPDLEIIQKGSALKFGLITEGEADIYPRFGRTMEWDTAAGHALLLCLGGSVNNIDTNEPLAYNKKDSSNPSFIAKSKEFSYI